MKTRAAVLWKQPGTWEVQEVELDDPGPTEVLVEMIASGLCHSDDHFTTGDMKAARLPFIGGHEGAGIVRAVGEQVTGFGIGDHVITAFLPACGACTWCARGLQNLCNNGADILEGNQPAGGYRMHADGQDIGTMSGLGSFAEHQVIDQLSLLKIDESIPLTSACLVSCGVQTGLGSATNAGNVRPGDVVLILGAGGVGMNAVQGAALAGARHVVVVDPAPFKLEQAPTFGATETFDNIKDAARFVRSKTDGQGADVVIVTVGVVRGEHIAQGFRATRKAGTLVVTGIGPDDDDSGVPVVNAFSLAMFQKRIQGAMFGMASPRDAMPTLLGLYQAGRLKLDELVTRRYSLDDINEAYRDMHAGINIRGILEF